MPLPVGNCRGMFSWCSRTFNQPVESILSNQMEVNNFLIELTSASISKEQPGLDTLSVEKSRSGFFCFLTDFLKCEDVSSKSRNMIIVRV